MQLPPWLLAGCEKSANNMGNRFDKSGEIRKRVRHAAAVLSSNRKAQLCLVLFLLFLVYFFPNWFGLGSHHLHQDASFFCLQDELRQYASLESTFDGVVQHHPTRMPAEKPYRPLVGNGHLGLTLGESDQRLRLKLSGSRALTSPVDIRPLIEVRIGKKSSSEAFVTDYKSGAVNHIQCFLLGDDCVTVSSSIMAHRKYPTLLVQEINIANPTDKSVTAEFGRLDTEWTDKTEKKRSSGEVVQILSHQVPLSEDNSANVVAVSTIQPKVHPTITVKPRSSEIYRFFTVVDFSEPTTSLLYANQRKTLEDKVFEDYENILKMDPASLKQEHVKIWNELWTTGFTMSYSRAPETLNPDRINATRYVVLSNSAAPLHEAGVDGEEVERCRRALWQTELCFNAHNTLLYPSKLWTDLDTFDDIIFVAHLWHLTLEKRGCMKLISAGADGIAQALVLSFGGLKFTDHHLEFGTHPSELHRDFEYRSLPFGETNASVTIHVKVGSDNKAQLHVSVTSTSQKGRKRPQMFACDAGCLDVPVELGPTQSQFPVKLTDPLTPILYITVDRAHVEELKHTIHVKEVAEAPAHEHHIIALHQHGHRLGGLPTFFWVALVFLIVLFHLFLFKMIYNEYFRGADQPNRNVRLRYES